MKITRSKLKELINEEYINYLIEAGLCHSPQTGHFADCKSGNVYSLTKKGAKSAGIDDEYVARGTLSSKEKNKPPKVSAKFGLNTSKEKSGGRKTIDGDDISPKFKVKDYPERYDEDNEVNNVRHVPQAERNSAVKSKQRSKKPSIVPSVDDSEMDRLDKLGLPKDLQSLGRGIVRSEDMEMDLTLSIQDIIDIVKNVLECPVNTTLENKSSIKNACYKAGYISIADAQRRILTGVSNAVRASKGEIGVKAN
jgi:hypothetical protein